MKITMNVNDELLKEIDEYAKANYTNRTAVMSIATKQYLLQQQMYITLRNMDDVCKKLLTDEDITEDDKKSLLDMSNSISLLIQK